MKSCEVNGYHHVYQSGREYFQVDDLTHAIKSSDRAFDINI